MYNRSKKKASLATIEERIQKMLVQISSYETELAKCRTQLLKPSISKIEIDLIQATVLQLHKIPASKWHFLRWVVGLEKHKEPKNGLLEELYNSERYTRYAAYMDLISRISDLEKSIKSWRSGLLRLEEAAVPMRKKKDFLVELRAAAALNAKKTREVGATVKRGLTRQPWCPYCGNSIDEYSHVDHIYPVSKGGRSVPKNMVYVCVQCNIMKSNLTLTGFIQKFSLDRDVIEERLKQLNKEF